MRSSVGINKTVNAEIAVVRKIAEVSAVGVFVAAVTVGYGNGMIGVFPDTAAAEFVVGLYKLPVITDISGAVAHCVTVFTEVERLILTLLA